MLLRLSEEAYKLFGIFHTGDAQRKESPLTTAQRVPWCEISQEICKEQGYLSSLKFGMFKNIPEV